jgi:hypothetical protein
MAKERPAPVYGPAPEWQAYRERGERAIISRLIDPDSAKISWMGGYYQGEYKPFLEPRVSGYIGCGLVNAKNRMGGYTGDRAFVVVIDHDLLRYAEIDSKENGLVAAQCVDAMQKGLLAPVPAATATATPSSPTGLTLRVMPEGAYVSAVAPGSVAHKAGLRPGMVIETINAIALQNMGEAMIKVIEAAGAGASLGLVGGKIIKMGERP